MVKSQRVPCTAPRRTVLAVPVVTYGSGTVPCIRVVNFCLVVSEACTAPGSLYVEDGPLEDSMLLPPQHRDPISRASSAWLMLRPA